MVKLPKEVSCYAKTPEFTEQSMPENLQESHRTKAGTWAKIVVREGALLFRILEPKAYETELRLGKPGVIEPETAHEVKPLGNVRFAIEFYR